MLGSAATQLTRDERAQTSTLLAMVVGLAVVGVLFVGLRGGSNTFGELLAPTGPINQLFNGGSAAPSSGDSDAPSAVSDEVQQASLPTSLPRVGDGPVSRAARTSPVAVAALALAVLTLVAAARVGTAPQPGAPAARG